jgi:hypothetical protein
MNFVTDYKTAYQLLREGRVDRDYEPSSAFPHSISWTEVFKKPRVNALSTIQAIFHAFKLSRAMRQQRALVQHVYPAAIEEKKDDRPILRKEIKVLPITVNHTTVKTNPKDD